MEPEASPGNEGQMNKSFLLSFQKREQEKNFFLKKAAKTFVNCSSFDDWAKPKNILFVGLARELRRSRAALPHCSCSETGIRCKPLGQAQGPAGMVQKTPAAQR
jgi:hypothetical protein